MRIVPFTDALAPAFRAINAAWIADMFTLEPHDEHVLSHPRAAIIEPGGVILFALAEDGTPVGTGALMPTAPMAPGGRAVELTKMGVLAGARGLGVGAALLDALIERACAMPDLDTFYLLTNARAAAAIHLYERAGFVHDAAIMAAYGATYARCDVAMRYPLAPAVAMPAGERPAAADR